MLMLRLNGIGQGSGSQWMSMGDGKTRFKLMHMQVKRIVVSNPAYDGQQQKGNYALLDPFHHAISITQK